MKSALILVVALPLLAWAQAAPKNDTLTINKVVQEVVAKNDRLAAARFMEKSASDKIGPAGAWNDPMLMLGIQNMPTSFDLSEEEMTMKMIGISQDIPYAGQKGLERKAAKADFQAAKEETRGTVSDLATSAKYAYLDLYYRRQALRYVQSQRGIQDDIVSSAIVRLGSDRASQADVAVAQADLWRLDADILSTEQDIETAENGLLALMGRDAGSELPILIEPRFGILAKPLETWLASARDNYPEFKRLASQGESYRFSAAASRKMRYPMLSLSASYGLRSDAPLSDPMNPGMERSNMISFQANISLPFFSGRQQGKMASSMEAMGKSAEAEAGQLWRDTEARLRTLYERAQRLRQSLDLYNTKIIPADDDAFRSGFAAYNTNRLPLSTLLGYALNIYRDRLVANRLALDLARTAAEAERYVTNPDIWVTR